MKTLRNFTLWLLLAVFAAGDSFAQILIPATEATAAQATAGIAGNVFISPRRLAGNDITVSDLYVGGDDIFGVLGLNVTASQTTNKNLTLSSTGTADVIIKRGSTVMATFDGATDGVVFAGPVSGITTLTVAGAVTGVTTLGMSGALTVDNITATTLTLSGNLVLGASTSSITGAAGNMTITAGTGNSRTLTFRTTTSGGTATDAVVLDATQGLTFKGGLLGEGATGGMPAGAGAANFTGLAVNGVAVATSSDTYWEPDTAGIKYAAGVNSTPIGQTTPAAGSFTTGTFTGAVSGITTLGTSGAITAGGDLLGKAAAGTARGLYFVDNAINARWSIIKNATAESGANTGSDLDIQGYSDAGNPFASPYLRITRATGAATFAGPVSGITTLATSGTWTSTKGGEAFVVIPASATETYIGIKDNTNSAYRASLGWKQSNNTGYVGNDLGPVMSWAMGSTYAATFAGAVSGITTLATSGAITAGADAAASVFIAVNAAGGASQGGYYTVKSAGVAKSYIGGYAVIRGGGTDQSLLLQSTSDDVWLNADTSSKAIRFGYGGTERYTFATGAATFGANVVASILNTTAATTSAGALKVGAQTDSDYVNIGGGKIVAGGGITAASGSIAASLAVGENNSAAAGKQISIGTVNYDLAARLNIFGGSAHKGFSIGVQDLVSDALTITPSTANGGTTFTTPAVTITTAGNTTLAGNLSVSGGTTTFSNGWSAASTSTSLFSITSGAASAFFKQVPSDPAYAHSIQNGTADNAVKLVVGTTTYLQTVGFATPTAVNIPLALTLSAATASITLGASNTGSLAVTSDGDLTVTPKSGRTLTIATGTAGVTATGTGTHAFGTSAGGIISLPSTTGAAASGGLLFGADTNLYRSAASTLKTDDALIVDGALTTTGVITAGSGPTTVTDAAGKVLSAALNTVAVANGGTGATTLTANNVILGNGSSAVQFVAPGTSGNVLVSNGTTWTSGAGTTPTFAEIYIADGSTGQSIPTGSTYTKLTAFTTDGVSANCTAAAASDKITVTVAGTYRITFGTSITSDTNNVVWNLAVFSGGVEQTNVECSRKVGTGADVGDCGRSGLITISSVPVDIDLRAKHNNVGSVVLTPIHANLNVTKVN